MLWDGESVAKLDIPIQLIYTVGFSILFMLTCSTRFSQFSLLYKDECVKLKNINIKIYSCLRDQHIYQF